MSRSIKVKDLAKLILSSDANVVKKHEPITLETRKPINIISHQSFNKYFKPSLAIDDFFVYTLLYYYLYGHFVIDVFRCDTFRLSRYCKLSLRAQAILQAMHKYFVQFSNNNTLFKYHISFEDISINVLGFININAYFEMIVEDFNPIKIEYPYIPTMSIPIDRLDSDILQNLRTILYDVSLQVEPTYDVTPTIYKTCFCITGTACSGKTTTLNQLKENLNLPIMKCSRFGAFMGKDENQLVAQAYGFCGTKQVHSNLYALMDRSPFDQWLWRFIMALTLYDNESRIEHIDKFIYFIYSMIPYSTWDSFDVNIIIIIALNEKMVKQRMRKRREGQDRKRSGIDNYVWFQNLVYTAFGVLGKKHIIFTENKYERINEIITEGFKYNNVDENTPVNILNYKHVPGKICYGFDNIYYNVAKDLRIFK